MGPGTGLVGYRYSTLPVPTQPPLPTTPGTPPPATRCTAVHARGQSGRVNMAVGLISVEQLSLEAQISDISLMTEVYNVAEAGNPDDHNVIAGNE